MNILMMTLLYPEDQLAEVTANALDKLQNQINNYQRAFEEGIRNHLQPGESLQLLNSLPVGIFPIQYKKLFLKSGWHDNHSIRQIGCINLPWFKQTMRVYAAERELLAWAAQSSANRTVLVYTQYLPYMQAILRVKKKYPDLKAAVIVTDLPNELGLASGRKGLLQKIEYARGKKSMSLCAQMDGFILLTEPMAEALKIQDKPYEVIEGLILEKVHLPIEQSAPVKKPTVLYSGTLEPDLGIGEMLRAFEDMPEFDLWICGQGGMKHEVEDAAKRCDNIHYFGFVPQKKALALQASASALINPRQPNGLFTKYSFPSKTLEYLRSGKPVLCFKLEGIPKDYDPYLCYIQHSDEKGIQKAVRKLLSESPEELQKKGQEGRSFVLAHKNPSVQCKRLIQLLRRL